MTCLTHAPVPLLSFSKYILQTLGFATRLIFLLCGGIYMFSFRTQRFTIFRFFQPNGLPIQLVLKSLHHFQSHFKLSLQIIYFIFKIICIIISNLVMQILNYAFQMTHSLQCHSVIASISNTSSGVLIPLG